MFGSPSCRKPSESETTNSENFLHQFHSMAGQACLIVVVPSAPLATTSLKPLAVDTRADTHTQRQPPRKTPATSFSSMSSRPRSAAIQTHPARAHRPHGTTAAAVRGGCMQQLNTNAPSRVTQSPLKTRSTFTSKYFNSLLAITHPVVTLSKKKGGKKREKKKWTEEEEA